MAEAHHSQDGTYSSLPRHKKAPMNNVMALFQTGVEKSIAKGAIIDRMANDRDGITSWKMLSQGSYPATILYSYQFFYKINYLYNFEILSARW